jgi:hypothetical protein
MKYALIILILTMSSTVVHAQQVPCYTAILTEVQGLKSAYKWGHIKVTAREAELLKFVRSNRYIDCSALLNTADELKRKWKKNADCPPQGIIKIELQEPADVLQFYNEVKAADPNTNAEVCINSEGNITISMGTGDGTISLSSNGKFSLAVKGPDGMEHKAEF